MTGDTAVNGVRVVTETIPHFRSVAFGVWIFAGSRDETDEESGLFHFLEHLVFKGTAARDAVSIAMEIDELGGHIDAFTSREVTCFSGHVLERNLDRAFDLVADITLNSTFPEEEVERERMVVLEEIRSIDDNPAEYIHDRLYPAMFGAHPLGRLITGVPETVRSLTRENLLRLREKFYRPPRILVAACGGVTHERMEKLAMARFGGLAACPAEKGLATPEFAPRLEVIEKPLEQNHLVLAVPGLTVTDPRRHELSLLNLILGGCVSSRLFQTVREKQGLAYSIYSFFDQYLDAGLFGVYAACSPAALEPLWNTVKEELRRISAEPPTADELNRAKAQSYDNIEMGFESLSVRLSQLAHQTFYFDKIHTREEMLGQVRGVTADGISELASQLLGNGGYNVISLGPVNEEKARTVLS